MTDIKSARRTGSWKGERTGEVALKQKGERGGKTLIFQSRVRARVERKALQGREPTKNRFKPHGGVGWRV